MWEKRTLCKAFLFSVFIWRDFTVNAMDIYVGIKSSLRP